MATVTPIFLSRFLLAFSFCFIPSFCFSFLFLISLLLLFHFLPTFSPFSPFSLHFSLPFWSIDRMGKKEGSFLPSFLKPNVWLSHFLPFFFYSIILFMTSSLTWLNMSHGIISHTWLIVSHSFNAKCHSLGVPCGIP